MSEDRTAQPGAAPAVPGPAGDNVAGALLRQAREDRHLGLEQLAQLLKVPERKLQALEEGRYDELPGMAFVRGLAQTVARQLGIDPKPVLEALPTLHTAPQRLESVSRGLATPYREHAGPSSGAGAWLQWLKPVMLVPAALLLLALLLWFVPPVQGLFAMLDEGAASGEPAASEVAEAAEDAASEPVQALPVVLVGPVGAAASAATGAPVAASAPAPAASGAVVDTVFSAPREMYAAAGQVVLRTSAESWIEARDATGKSLLSRMVLQGEEIGLDGTLPIRLKVGNASGTQVIVRGQPLDLAPYTRDNIARMELK